MHLKIITPFKFIKKSVYHFHTMQEKKMCAIRLCFEVLKRKYFGENKYKAVFKNLTAKEVTMSIPNLITSLRFFYYSKVTSFSIL